MSGSARRGRSAAKMGSSDALQSQPIIAIGSTLPSVSLAPSPLDLPLVSFSVNVPPEAPQSHSGGDAANAPSRNCSIASGATTTLPSPSDSDHSSSSGDSMLRAAKSIASLTDTSQLLTALLGPSHSSAASSASSIASRHCGPTIAALPEAVGAEDFDCDSVSVTSAPVKPKSAPRSKEANMRKRRRREINRTKPIAECRSAPCSHTRSQPKPFHFWQASWGDASQVVRRQFREANLLSCFYRCGAKPLARFRRTSPELTVKCLEIRLDDTFCLNLSNSKKEDPEGKFIEFVAQNNPDVSIVFAAGPVHQGRSVRVSESNNKIKPSFLRDRTKTAKGARSSSTCICPRPNTPFGCNHLDGCPKDRYLDVYVIIGNNTRACLPQDPSFKLTVEWSLGFCGKDPMNYQKFDLEGAEDKEDSSNSESQSDHESDMVSPSPSTASSSSSKPRSKPRSPKAKQAAANASPVSMPTASSSVPKAETSRKTDVAKTAKAAKRRAPSKRHKTAEVSVINVNHSWIDISTDPGFLRSHPLEVFGEMLTAQPGFNFPSSPDSGVAETADGEDFPLQISQPMDAFMDNESEATEMSESGDSSAFEARSHEDIMCRAPGRASSFLPIQFDEDSSSVDSVQNSPCGRTEASVNPTSHSAIQLLPRSLTMENQERSAIDYLFPSAARAPTLDLMSLPDWSGTADAVEYTQDSSTSSDRR